jgi:hypothetical protein
MILFFEKTFDPKDLVNCVKNLLKLDKIYMNSNLAQRTSVRSILIGTEGNVDIQPTKEALLYVIAYKTNFPPIKPKPIGVYIDPRYTRSWFGWIAKHRTSAYVMRKNFFLSKLLNYFFLKNIFEFFLFEKSRKFQRLRYNCLVI